MIIRIKKRDHPFVMIDKRPLENRGLSWKAKGILSYLLTKPDNWTVVVKELIKASTDNGTAVRSGLQELRRKGYAGINQLRSEDGKRAAGTEWVIYEEPENLTFRKPESQKNLKLRKSNTTNNEELILSNDSLPIRKDRCSQTEAEDFCVTLGLPRSDGEAMWLHWQEKEWKGIKDWKLTIRKWKSFHYLPSQKNSKWKNGRGFVKTEPINPAAIMIPREFRKWMNETYPEKIYEVRNWRTWDDVPSPYRVRWSREMVNPIFERVGG